MRLPQNQKLRKTIRWLRKEFPTYYLPVQTRQIALKDGCGDCGIHSSFKMQSDFFLIRINKNDTFQVKVDTLLHEWAHTLTWCDTEYEDHSGKWGEAYARIYRAWLKWDFGRGEK